MSVPSVGFSHLLQSVPAANIDLHLAIKIWPLDVVINHVRTLKDPAVLNVKKDGTPPLHQAINQGKQALALILMEKGADPFLADETTGKNCLHLCAESGRTEILPRMMQAPGLAAHIDACDKKNKSPLFLACEHGNGNVAQVLINGVTLENGTKIHSDVGKKNGLEGHTALHKAAKRGDKQLVALLLNAGANIDDETTTSVTPLCLGCVEGHLEIVKYLFDWMKAHQMDIAPRLNKTHGSTLVTLLHVAANSGHVQIVKLLLTEGADSDARTSEGYTPLNFAIEDGRLEVVECLLSWMHAHEKDVPSKLNDSNRTSSFAPLHTAIVKGYLQVVEALLVAGADMDAPTDEGLSPLYLACNGGKVRIVKFLLDWMRKQGILVTPILNGVNGDNLYTSLHIAAKLGFTQVVKVLLDAGAKIDVKTKEGFSPLYLASLEGKQETVECLLTEMLRRGDNISSKLNEGSGPPDNYTPLEGASAGGYVQVATTLIVAGADIMVGSPLAYAAFAGRHEMVKFLIERMKRWRIDIQPKLNEVNRAGGFTLLHIGAYKGHIKVVEVLLDEGADIYATSRSGSIPLEEALAQKKVEVAKLLFSKGHMKRVSACVNQMERQTKKIFVEVETCLRHYLKIESISTVKEWMDANPVAIEFVRKVIDWHEKELNSALQKIHHLSETTLEESLFSIVELLTHRLRLETIFEGSQYTILFIQTTFQRALSILSSKGLTQALDNYYLLIKKSISKNRQKENIETILAKIDLMRTGITHLKKLYSLYIVQAMQLPFLTLMSNLDKRYRVLREHCGSILSSNGPESSNEVNTSEDHAAKRSRSAQNA